MIESTAAGSVRRASEGSSAAGMLVMFILPDGTWARSKPVASTLFRREFASSKWNRISDALAHLDDNIWARITASIMNGVLLYMASHG